MLTHLPLGRPGFQSADLGALQTVSLTMPPFPSLGCVVDLQIMYSAVRSEGALCFPRGPKYSKRAM